MNIYLLHRCSIALPALSLVGGPGGLVVDDPCWEALRIQWWMQSLLSNFLPIEVRRNSVIVILHELRVESNASFVLACVLVCKSSESRFIPSSYRNL